MTAIEQPPRLAQIEAALADVNAIAAAEAIVAAGPRGAIQASTVEIMAIAMLLLQLCAIADRTYDLFGTADQLEAERDPARRAALRTQVAEQISAIGHRLEALGYGQSSPTKET